MRTQYDYLYISIKKWFAYVKNCNVHYFDIFGNLKAPQELVKYFDNEVKFINNHSYYQKFSQIIQDICAWNFSIILCDISEHVSVSYLHWKVTIVYSPSIFYYQYHWIQIIITDLLYWLFIHKTVVQMLKKIRSFMC